MKATASVERRKAHNSSVKEVGEMDGVGENRANYGNRAQDHQVKCCMWAKLRLHQINFKVFRKRARAPHFSLTT